MIRFLSNLIVLSVTLFIGTFLFEFCVRQFLPQYDPSGHLSFTSTADGVPVAYNKGFSRQIKNTGDYNVSININNIGLRESKQLSAATKTDIIVVGDSFSFGWGVEEHERYSNRLDAMLIDQNVFNISIPTNFDGYEKLINYAIENNARIQKLIVGVTMENDLSLYGIKKIRDNKTQQSSRGIVGFNSLKMYLREHSAAYFLITSLIHSNPVFRGFAVALGMITPNLEGIPSIEFSQKIIGSSISRLRELIRPYEATVLIIPSRALWVGTKESRNIADQFHRAFTKELDYFKIKYVDPRGLMEKNHKPLAYHFKYDGHWTRDAHQIAANALARAINDH